MGNATLLPTLPYFAMGETIQRSFESGAIFRVNYGRFENALAHFHRSIREALEATA